VIKPAGSEVTTAWHIALEGFELDQLALDRSPKSIRNRLPTMSLFARWASAQKVQPGDVTKVIMKSYLVQQIKGRKGSGAGTLYQDLKVFWDWYAREYETSSPITGIPRPKGKSRTVPGTSRTSAARSGQSSSGCSHKGHSALPKRLHGYWQVAGRHLDQLQLEGGFLAVQGVPPRVLHARQH
jgi:hypothetical protein